MKRQTGPPSLRELWWDSTFWMGYRGSPWSKSCFPFVSGVSRSGILRHPEIDGQERRVQLRGGHAGAPDREKTDREEHLHRPRGESGVKVASWVERDSRSGHPRCVDPRRLGAIRWPRLVVRRTVFRRPPDNERGGKGDRSDNGERRSRSPVNLQGVSCRPPLQRVDVQQGDEQ